MTNLSGSFRSVKLFKKLLLQRCW